MLPTPNIDDAKIPEARKWQAIGAHRKVYTFSEEDYADAAGVWSGPADWADGEPLEVIQGVPEYSDGRRTGCRRMHYALFAGLCH